MGVFDKDDCNPIVTPPGPFDWSHVIAKTSTTLLPSDVVTSSLFTQQPTDDVRAGAAQELLDMTVRNYVSVMSRDVASFILTAVDSQNKPRNGARTG